MVQRYRGRKKSHRRAGTATVLPDNGLTPYLTHYLEWLRIKGFSETTVVNREGDLSALIRWCDERQLHAPGEISKPMIERYQRHLYYYRKENGEPLAYSSQRKRFTSVKAWFKWLTQENYIPGNPASEVAAIKVPKSLPAKVLSVEEVRHILASLDVSDAEGLRDRAIVEVLYSTGIRRSELCGLLVSDIDRVRRSVFVRKGKGGSDRCIPIGEQALVWVQRYLERGREQLRVNLQEYALFLNVHGEAFTPGGLGHLVKRLLRHAEIECEGSCHLFRHAMATHMLDNGAELRYIQAILGHADINTTTIYTHLSIATLQQVHAATHPEMMKSERSVRGDGL